ncbi:hypothetical protein CBP52_11725 [Cellulomonas sp. PSBB021]|nr:hypothetical protein CBP52_11725 [Cellulomonas sp. PSBB021]
MWVDAVLMCEGQPVARIVQHGDGGPDAIRPLAPATWADVHTYETYARTWGAPYGIVHEPSNALTAALLERWAATRG